MSYCTYIPLMAEPSRSLHANYHDNHYGFPIHNDNELFGRLILEINQAGLSWETILKKEDGFRRAYDNFNIEKIAAYTESDRERLLNDSGIIRNRLKRMPPSKMLKQFFSCRKNTAVSKNGSNTTTPRRRKNG